MATLERIRRRSGLLIVAIGLAMGAFILTDLLGSGGILFQDNINIGSINGQKITRQDFAGRMAKLRATNPQVEQYSSKTIADAVWGQLEREHILGEQSEILGFGITPSELVMELKNVPWIQQNFADETGQLTEARFAQVLTLMENSYLDGNPQGIEQWTQWLEVEKSVKQQALATKYNSAVKYGIYVPSKLGEQEYIKSSQTVQGNFLQLPYSSIEDSTINLSDGDLKSYYNSHKADYEKEESRDISFVTFSILPSQEDKDEVLLDMNNLLEDQVETYRGKTDTILGFNNTDDDSTFVSTFSDVPFEDKYYTKGELPSEYDTVAFSNEVGHIEGPFIEGQQYVMYKIESAIEKPDSVKARHILIKYQGVQEGENVQRTGQEAQTLTDSLFNIIKEDVAQFDTISTKHNEDLAAKMKGGDLGWFTADKMVEPFSKYCFRHTTGDVGIVYSQFGIHIVVIDDTKGANKAVRLATIRRAIIPSDKTHNDIHREASLFASEAKNTEDYNTLAMEKGYMLRPANGLLKGDENIPGLGQEREIVLWAFGEDVEKGKVNVFETSNFYITAILTNKYEEGIQPLDIVKDEVEIKAREAKKAEMLIKKINDANATDINTLATAVEGEVRPQATSMAGSALSGVGPEPKVIGVFSGIEPNTLSKPIKGNSGVFVVTISERSTVLEKPDYKNEQNQVQSQVRNLVDTQIFESLKKNADIESKVDDAY